MAEYTEIFFQVKVPNPDVEPIAPRIHEAFAEFARSNPSGSHPRLTDYLASNGVTICWATEKSALDQ